MLGEVNLVNICVDYLIVHIGIYLLSNLLLKWVWWFTMLRFSIWAWPYLSRLLALTIDLLSKLSKWTSSYLYRQLVRFDYLLATRYGIVTVFAQWRLKRALLMVKAEKKREEEEEKREEEELAAYFRRANASLMELAINRLGEAEVIRLIRRRRILSD